MLLVQPPVPTQVIATACLHLAAKVQESPKPIREVIRECERIRHCKNPELLKLLNDPVRRLAANEDEGATRMRQ